MAEIGAVCGIFDVERRAGLTYRRLLVIAEAIQRERWNHTAMLCAVNVSCHSKPGAKIDPRLFHPMEKEAAAGQAIDVDAETVGAIGRMFHRQKQEYGT